MKILIKTPLYKNSKYIPHLVEHSIFHNTNQNFKTYLNLQYPISAVTETGYTEFSLPKTIDAENFLKNNILQEIVLQTVKTEKKIISDENRDTSYRQDLLIKIWQKLYNKNFSLSRWYNTNFKEISWYRNKYYKNWNIIICDDNYNQITLFQQQIKTENLKSIETNFQISLNYEKYNIYSKSFWSRKDFYLMKFIETLISIYLARDNTINQHNYFYEDEWFFIIDEYLALSLPDKTKINITQDMIKQSKQYFKKAIKNNEFLFWKILTQLYFGKKIQQTDIIKYIDTIKNTEIQKILSILT